MRNQDQPQAGRVYLSTTRTGHWDACIEQAELNTQPVQALKREMGVGFEGQQTFLTPRDDRNSSSDLLKKLHSSNTLIPDPHSCLDWYLNKGMKEKSSNVRHCCARGRQTSLASERSAHPHWPGNKWAQSSTEGPQVKHSRTASKTENRRSSFAKSLISLECPSQQQLGAETQISYLLLAHFSKAVLRSVATYCTSGCTAISHPVASDTQWRHIWHLGRSNKMIILQTERKLSLVALNSCNEALLPTGTSQAQSIYVFCNSRIYFQNIIRDKEYFLFNN